MRLFNFKKPKNELEVYLKQQKKSRPIVPDEMFTVCPSCKTAILSSELNERFYVCKKCNHHFAINSRQRIDIICDEGSFIEHNSDLTAKNIIDFPSYEKKLKNAMLESGEKDGVVTGVGSICGNETAIFVMEPRFMMGSMGSVVGEKITCLFEYAATNNLPVVGYTVSGGARMQEGIISLMQMAKTSGAVKRHSDKGLLYVAVLTNPTTGGVTASFAMEADITLAEPSALIAFAGPRVIEQTTGKKLPQGFQRSEFLLEKGFVDIIAERNTQKELLAQLLNLHRDGDTFDTN